ncbi:MAG: hypothetical protein IJW18_08120 [Lachnospiraceae bacterium]|nr:hypothetical protein [Lachnospiraceae bacterium]
MAGVKAGRKTCFIITPIGGNGTAIRRKIEGIIDEVIEPVLSELNYIVSVSHRINEPGSVSREIIKNVYESDLVIANLTGNNPNVMYEVALRHASAKPIIHITENISDLPFDINDQRTIEYADDMAGAYQLKIDLREMIKCIEFDKPAANPITLALEEKNLVNIPESTSKDFGDMLIQLTDDIRQIKKEVAITKESNRFNDYTKLKGKISPLVSPFDYRIIDTSAITNEEIAVIDIEETK